MGSPLQLSFATHLRLLEYASSDSGAHRSWRGTSRRTRPGAQIERRTSSTDSCASPYLPCRRCCKSGASCPRCASNLLACGCSCCSCNTSERWRGIEPQSTCSTNKRLHQSALAPTSVRSVGIEPTLNGLRIRCLSSRPGARVLPPATHSPLANPLCGSSEERFHRQQKLCLHDRLFSSQLVPPQRLELCCPEGESFTGSLGFPTVNVGV